MKSGTRVITAILAGALALAALPAVASAATWTRANTTPMNLSPDPAPTTPYPSTIAVEDLPGNVTKVVPTFVGVRHTGAGDIDALLLGPNGQNVMLMSDAPCGNIFNPARDLTFDDAAATELIAPCPEGSYKPTNGPPVMHRTEVAARAPASGRWPAARSWACSSPRGRGQ